MEIISNILVLFSFKFDQFFLKVLLAINDVEKFKKKYKYANLCYIKYSFVIVIVKKHLLEISKTTVTALTFKNNLKNTFLKILKLSV